MLNYEGDSELRIIDDPILCGTNFVRNGFQHLWNGKGDLKYKKNAKNRDKLGQYILWKPKGGTSSIWFENLTNLDQLSKHQSAVHTCHLMRDVEAFLDE